MQPREALAGSRRSRRDLDQRRRRPAPRLSTTSGSISSATSRISVSRSLWRCTTRIDHAVLEQVLRALEALRQLLADGVLDHARAGEADDGVGLGDDRRRPAWRTRPTTPPVVGSVSTHDVGQARFLDAGARRWWCACICISDRMPSCMRAPPEAENTISGALRATRKVGRHHQPLAHRGAHRAAHEAEIERRQHGHAIAHQAARHDERVARCPRPWPAPPSAARHSAWRRGTSADRPSTLGSGCSSYLPSSNRCGSALQRPRCACDGRNGCRPPGWPPSRA